MSYELEIVARLIAWNKDLTIFLKAPNFSQSAAIYFLMIFQLHTLSSEHNFMTFLSVSTEQGKNVAENSALS